MEAENQGNPLHWPMHQAPRCTARSKRTGQPCRAPAVSGWRVCRMHGAGGGAPKGKRNGRYRSSLFTKELTKARRLIRALGGPPETLRRASEPNLHSGSLKLQVKLQAASTRT